VPIREKVILDAEEKVSKEFKKAGGSADEFGKKLDKLAKGVLGAIIVKKVADLGSAIVGMAIDAEEAGAAFDTTFGVALPKAEAFVESFANKAGFASFELKQLLAITGNVVQGIGATEEESFKLSETMARLAGDVASFSNAEGGAEAVLLALQSAINGEREALKTYGLAISETEVVSLALQTTEKSRADELTRLEKAQATVTIATQKAGKSIGDLDRTSDSAANAIRRIGARFKEAGVTAGQALLPALESLLPVIEDMIPAMTDAGVAIASFIASAGPGVATALGVSVELVDGLGFAINNFVAIYAAGRVVLEETFSFGMADTKNLQGVAKAATNANVLRNVVRQLHKDLVGGKTNADRYANALLDIARRSDLSAEALTRVAIASGATKEEQVNALIALKAFADERNWRTENIDVLITGLRELLGVTDALPPPLDELVNGVANLAPALEEAGDAAEEVVEELTDAQQAILDMADAAEEGAAAFRDDLAQEAGDFITGFEKLPKRIKITMDKFEKNLTDRIVASAEFWNNLGVLASEGFGHLAEAIREQGPEAAGLLEDLVGDLERAAELDNVIAEAGDQMAEVTDAYATALEQEGDSSLTAMSTYGRALIDAIAEGVESGDLAGPLLAKIRSAVRGVTGRFQEPFLPPTGTAGTRFQGGTWDVPGGPSDEVAATVHGTEIIIPPEGSGGRAEFARQLAVELSRSMGTEGGSQAGGPSVHIEQILVQMPAGATLTEIVSESAAEAAIEALLS